MDQEGYGRGQRYCAARGAGMAGDGVWASRIIADHFDAALLAAGATQGYVPLRSTAPLLRTGSQQRTGNCKGNNKINCKVNSNPQHRRLYC